MRSTRFQHRRRHLETWFSNDGRTRNQIDHILVRSRWASSVLNCRAFRSVDTGSANDTDLALVRASVRPRLKKIQRTQRAPRIDASRLNTAAGEMLHVELHNRFSHLAELAQETQLESEWKELKFSSLEAAASILGHSRRRRRDWINGPILELADQMQQARVLGDRAHEPPATGHAARMSQPQRALVEKSRGNRTRGSNL